MLAPPVLLCSLNSKYKERTQSQREQSQSCKDTYSNRASEREKETIRKRVSFARKWNVNIFQNARSLRNVWRVVASGRALRSWTALSNYFIFHLLHTH